MILTILVAIFALVALMVLHEFGHFVLAKKFGTKVEEFGVGLPPRLFGKKFGETVYSLNLIPFGAFVKIHGEQGGVEDIRSFSEKPIWQRALIVLGGVVMFWIIAAVLLMLVLYLGMPIAVSDSATGLSGIEVRVAEVAKDSPAAEVGLKPLDTILKLESSGEIIKPNKVKQVKKFTDEYRGKEITMTIKRWDETEVFKMNSRVTSPTGQGPLGIEKGLVRTAIFKLPPGKALLRGPSVCVTMTINAVKGLGGLAIRAFQGKGMPPGSQPMGPIGIFGFLNQAAQSGVSNFLRFVAIISIFLAIFNILPIPALDGGKLVFLALEKVKGKPVSPKVEERITNFFFVLLITLMLVVTIKFDLPRLF